MLNRFANFLACNSSTNSSNRTNQEIHLSDLRLPGEAAHEMVNVPRLAGTGLARIGPTIDQTTAHLRGRAYLQHLTTDHRLYGAIRELVASDKILLNRNRTEENLSGIAERLRPVVADICHQNASRQFGLSTEINELASDALGHCGDRADFVVGQMEDVALLGRLTRGQIDEVSLYNHGVSFFMLNQIRAETGREANRRRPGIHQQGVHDHLDAEFFLQDQLHLPHRVGQPQHRNVGFMTREIANGIGAKVRQAATANDGENVIQFMSTWNPWVQHLRRQPQHRADFERMTQNFHDALERLERDRNNPASPVNAMDEHEYGNAMGAIGRNREAWESDYVGQLSRTFLMNHRADYLANQGLLPRYFR